MQIALNRENMCMYNIAMVTTALCVGAVLHVLKFKKLCLHHFLPKFMLDLWF